MKANNKGYTMVELLAVVVLLGIFTIIGIASVNGYIISSRKTVYAQMARNFIKEARNQISSKEITGVSSPNKVYYIDIEKLVGDSGKLEPSPFGTWVEAYVIYAPSENGQDKYYFVSLDSEGWMIKRTEESKITKKSVIRDAEYEGVDIDLLGTRDVIEVVDKNGNKSETTASKAWSRAKTKECFSFKDINSTEVELIYYNKDCLSADGEVTIPTKVGGKAVTAIHGYTFYNMGVKSVIIPVGVKTIGSRAFGYNQLTSIKIPSTVTTLDSEAFLHNNLTSVTMTKSTKTIGDRCFQYNSLSGVITSFVPNPSASIGACAFCNNLGVTGASFKYKLNNDGTYDYTTIVGYIGDLSEFSDKVFRIPATNNGVALTTIANSAFYRTYMTDWEVIIPDTVTYIGSSAFTDDMIKKVHWPSGLKTISNYAFYNNKLTTLSDLPSSVNSIGASAFNNNLVTDDTAWVFKKNTNGTNDTTQLVSYAGFNKANLTVPSSVTKIGTGTFRELSLTGKLTLPSNFTFESDNIFSEANLTSVDNGDGVDTLFVYDRNANGTINKSVVYAYLGRLKENVQIPNTVTELRAYSFYRSYTKSVIIPESVTKIGNYAFHICRLSSITIPKSVKTIGTGALYKQITWTSMNGDLTKIVNKTNIDFNWQSITNGPSPAKFVTGTVENWYGDIEVTRE